MKPFISPDDALPAPLPDGGATEVGESCLPSKPVPVQQRKMEEKKAELHEQVHDELSSQE